MTAVYSAKKGVEAVIRADTGTNGLNDSDGNAFVRGLFFKIPPATVPTPRIVFNVIGPNENASGLQIQELTIVFEVYVDQVQQQLTYAKDTGTVEKEHYFGFQLDTGGGERVVERLRTAFQGVTLASDDSWTFSPLDRVDGDAGPVGALYTRFVEVYRCVASKTLSAPGSASGVVTGVGMSLTGTATDGTFNVHAPYAWRYALQQDLSDMTDRTARNDQFSSSSSRATLLIDFAHLTTTSPPVIPIGRLSALTLTVSPSVTFRLASGGWAHVRSMDVGASRMGGMARGRYEIAISGPTTPAYALPMYFEEGGSPL